MAGGDRKNRLLQAAASELIHLIMRLWFATVRVEVLNPGLYEEYFIKNRERGHVVAGCWHRGLIFFLYFFRNLDNRLVMVSRSRDGELVARVCRRLGYEVVRGSSAMGRPGRGGLEALKAMIDRLNAVDKPSFAGTALDGPLGPARKIQKGLLLAAKRTGAFFIPMALSGTRVLTFKKTWDRTIIPLPFSKVVIDFGQPFIIPAGLSGAELDELGRKTEEELNELTDRLDRRCGYQPPPVP